MAKEDQTSADDVAALRAESVRLVNALLRDLDKITRRLEAVERSIDTEGAVDRKGKGGYPSPRGPFARRAALRRIEGRLDKHILAHGLQETAQRERYVPKDPGGRPPKRRWFGGGSR